MKNVSIFFWIVLQKHKPLFTFYLIIIVFSTSFDLVKHLIKSYNILIFEITHFEKMGKW